MPELQHVIDVRVDERVKGLERARHEGSPYSSVKLITDSCLKNTLINKHPIAKVLRAGSGSLSNRDHFRVSYQMRSPDGQVVTKQLDLPVSALTGAALSSPPELDGPASVAASTLGESTVDDMRARARRIAEWAFGIPEAAPDSKQH
ncbi:hypothetical protein [Paraburkholderia caribensis]|uniref:hypothetical protein n=1 Tax=Paraburkholderia caribensis TaxID=75105 RepID=UPI0011E05ED2|nr:hypothetical protein [Paraburkholderia caribensis]